MNEGAHPAPRWRTHVVMLGLAALAAIVFLVVCEIRSPPSSDPLTGLVLALQTYGSILLTLIVLLSYSAASTLILFVLRRRRGAIGWAHGTSALFVVAFLSLDAHQRARKQAAEDLRHQMQLEAQALLEHQERAAAERARRDCLRVVVTADQHFQETSRTNRVDVELELFCDSNFIVHETWLEAIRLGAEGEGWKLEPLERHYEPALGVRSITHVPVGSFEWAGPSAVFDQVFEQGRFTLEVRFASDAGSEEWTPQEISAVRP